MADVKAERHGDRPVPKRSESFILDDPGVSAAMRTEAASRSFASNNWTMAALITANGGAAIALLDKADKGLAVAVALALYMLGITMALVAGRLAAVSAHEAEATFVLLLNLQPALRFLIHVRRAGTHAQVAEAEEHFEGIRKQVSQQQGNYSRRWAPDVPLGAGVICFFLGCIAAGFAIF